MGENALSTLILLSYSKMLRVAIGILNVKFLAVYVDSAASKTMARWANIPYLDPQKHLALFCDRCLSFCCCFPFLCYSCVLNYYLD